ncbi:MAG: hypothetical protein AAFO94_05460 [Bacteroidota bacterium]
MPRYLFSLLTLYLIFFSFGAFAQMSPDESWVTNEYDAFRIDTPDSVGYTPQKIPTELGAVDFHVYYVQAKLNDDPNQIYTYGYADYPPNVVHSDSSSLVQTFMDGSSQGAVQNLGGTLISQHDIEFMGFPGREFEVQTQDGITLVHFKILLVRNRFYILQVITIAEEKKNPRLFHFLDSFQLAG